MHVNTNRQARVSPGHHMNIVRHYAKTSHLNNPSMEDISQTPDGKCKSCGSMYIYIQAQGATEVSSRE